MADGDAELLSPSTRIARVAIPFQREVNRSVQSSASKCEKLRVVYDRTFDRFFLVEDLPPEQAPVTSPKTKRTRAQRTRVGKKRASGACVRWEDLILPPKSTAKRTAESVVYDYSGSLATDHEAKAESHHCGSVGEKAEEDASEVRKEEPQAGASPPPKEAVEKGGILEQTRPSDAVKPSGQDSPCLVTDVTTREESVLSSEPFGATQVINPVDVAENTSVSPQNAESMETDDCASSISAALSEQSALPIDSAESSDSVLAATSKLSSNQQITTCKLVSTVQLLRFLRRCVQKRRRRALHRISPPVEPVTATSKDLKTVDGTEPVATSPPSENLVEVGVKNPLVLQLDLVRLHDNQALSLPKPRSSIGKSPKRKNRVADYERHFAKAAASVSSFANSCLRVDNQEKSQVRWQGEILHVDVDIPLNEQECKDPQWGSQRSPQRQCFQPMSHIYSLKELMRIRPHADGFRRVNDGCKFTELTSSSSSSEDSEEEQVAVVRLDFSSEDEGGVEFKKGDSVLFFARHRWFHGKILKRIKKSWFYDIRAANGSVFEAVQAKRIRPFEQDEEPQYSFDVGDRVLWQPTATKRHAEQPRTFKARVLSIRRPSMSAISRDRRHHDKRYDIELLTGRVVKRVPHDELRPLR